MINYTFTQYWEQFEKALISLFEEYNKQSIQRDNVYVNYHNTVMEMVCLGKKIENANLYHKYRLGEQIKKTIKHGFPSKGVPTINSDYTLQLAKIFMAHSCLLASGQVHSEQTLVNTHLKSGMETAAKDVLTLDRRIKKYESTKIETNIQKTYCNAYQTQKGIEQQSLHENNAEKALWIDELNSHNACVHKRF
ncbi:hypothetical protein CC99x_010260 [Candidatus Berkiella cookevillensis]|uniref:Uncharacterized protein n=1 Tax=Candidatus Berkiella cookevillensis TaxID=437022 RepID=A0A0Q9YQZ5_9GAMM|nr:hypothetical protein [Candidatus Berkiella cookevillensis]MCS5709287.1 hypothetical protein [Candidatus Berkiella cookevillensis]